MEDQILIEERKRKVINFLKREYVYISIILIFLLILGIYIRSLPLQTNSATGKPGLWDFAKNEWTLGPDLDPWLFTRYAKTIITTGSLPHLDTMRSVPLGFDTTMELQMVSYMIVLTYKLVSPFYHTNLEFYAALMPVLFFALTILSFFFFVREIFTHKEKDNLQANLIASLSTLFMITIPIFISRTVAGIPEKESVGFFFMFLAFFLYLKAWKTEKNYLAYSFAALSGFATALMGLSWGGVIYVYIALALANFVSFLIGKINKREMIIYLFWVFISLVTTLIFTNHFSMRDFISSLDTGLSILVFLVFIVDFILWQTKLKDYVSKFKFIEKTKLPTHLLSVIFTLILGVILILLFFGPSFIFEKIQAINQMMFQPTTGRWNTTVAENRQPYFWEWVSSFGPFVGKFPVLFWLFLAGLVVMFKQTIKKIKTKDSWILFALFIFMICGMIFSRYDSAGLFNGENFISKAFYYFSALLLIIGGGYYYLKYEKEEENPLSEIKFELIFIIVLLVLCLFTARGAVRLIMTLGTIAPIFASYLCIFLGTKYFKIEDKTNKMIWGIVAGIVLILIFYCIFGVPLNSSKYPGFYQQAKGTSLGMVPYYYNFQWQNAMNWVDKNIPKDAVFAHWWDYGYWVQSIGNRATITDGGNAIAYWNYLSGRYVLTGDNQQDSLDFLYSHNATNLLIDSSDLGKYGAFSQIGSDINFDRLSGGPSTFLSNNKLIQEKQNSTTRVYQIPRGNNQIGIVPLEEDIYYKGNNTDIIILQDNSGIIGVTISSKIVGNTTQFSQPQASFIEANSQKRTDLPLRYLYYQGKFIDFGSGLNATAYILTAINGNSIDSFGAVMYISPRLMRGFLSQVYLLDDPLNNFPAFKLAHTEPNLIISSINSQNPNSNLGDFIYYNGIQGPIKIWNISYTGKEKLRPEFVDTDYSKYITWKL